MRPPPPPAPVRKTNLGLRLSPFELANGLRGVLVHDPAATEVQVTMRYQVGSVDDPPEHPGMAHLVEHLMFEQVLGTQSVQARLEQITTEFNAFTSFDSTTYVARAPTSRLDELLSIEAVRIGFRCTTITDSVFVREREVVINELRQREDATKLLDALHAGVFPEGHPYRRSIGGSEESVSSITREQACAFADAYYTTTNAVLVVSGNVTEQQLTASLGKFLARVARRDGKRPLPVPTVAMGPRQATAAAPLDEPALVIAWPLPASQHERTKVRAVAETVRSVVDREIAGQVIVLELGDDRAKLLSLVVFPGKDETIASLRDKVKRALDAAPMEFEDSYEELAKITFHELQQNAIYELFERFETALTRDGQIAAAMLAGRDPGETLAAEVAGLRDTNRAEVGVIARDYLRYDRAIIVELTPQDSTRRRGQKVQLTAQVHDRGMRRDVPDPEEARRPAPEVTSPPTFRAMTTRMLPNGLTVVLLPVTSVPTIDVRLVFRAGTADEPADKRGAALLAGYALNWDLRYLNDYLAFSTAGGRGGLVVDTDVTVFTARGLDMHVDFLLAGLRRWVREGRYDRSSSRYAEYMRRQTKEIDDEGALIDAWRTAVYGAGHPYVQAGLSRQVSPGVSIEDARQFRARYLTPDNATLVIAGRFDAATADRWIDYLFADWTGRAEPRHAVRARPQPASLAKDEDIMQTYISITLPAEERERAQHLVLTEMLRELAGDVRYQLGASYGLSATLTDARLATHYHLGGWVDAARGAEAIELLRARIDQLRTDADTAARAFVTARARVLTQLTASTGSAAELAGRVQRDVELGRAPVSDLATAEAVRVLTIDQLRTALDDLDLSRAILVMRGPRTEVDRAFAVLGRTPSYVQVTDLERDLRAERAEKGATTRSDTGREDDERLRPSDIEDALTTQGPRNPLTLAVMPAYTLSRFLGGSARGISVAAGVGYRIDHRAAIGLRASVGSLEGESSEGRLVQRRHPLAVVPLGLTAYVHGTGYDRLWGGVYIGVHRDRFTEREQPSWWQTSIGIGVEGGVDIVNLNGNRFGVFVRTESELGVDTVYTAFALGVGYRR
jgi:zinc protease